MNRRNFLKTGAFLPIGIAVFGNGIMYSATSANSSNFSLDIITNNPDDAIGIISKLIPDLTVQNVKFKETRLHGEYVGDIAFVKNGCLVNFYKSANKFDEKLKNAAKQLGLPSKIENPFLLSFSKSAKGDKPKYFDIYSDNKLTERIKIDEKHIGIKVNGLSGGLTAKTNDGTFNVVSSGCRHKTCMAAGSISNTGSSVVCIPNNIRITVSGGDHGLDSFNY